MSNIARLRPHNLVKVLWKDLLRTEGAIDVECAMYDYPSEFYNRVLDVRGSLLHRGYGVIIVSEQDDLCQACNKKDRIDCNLPDNGEGNQQFLAGCGLEIGVPYTNRQLLEKIRNYAALQVDEPMAILRKGFLDTLLIENEIKARGIGAYAPCLPKTTRG